MSIMFWTGLSTHIGTKEQVYVRRRYVDVNEKILSHGCPPFIRVIASGNMVDGISLPGSDMDYITAANDIPMSYDPENLNSDIIIDTENVKPGFVRLRCSDNERNHRRFAKALTQTGNGLYLSSSLIRAQAIPLSQALIWDAISHEPCKTYEYLDTGSGRLHCLSCNEWPRVATEWKERRRNFGWPPHDLIEDIVRDGYLLVSIGDPTSNESHMQWRISFLRAEKKLVRSFNHTQYLCYGLLQLYLKHIINSKPEVKDLLCTYYLKTSIFYCIEEENIVWSKEVFMGCFWTCYRRLMNWVRDGYCPSYFIKENNMFEGKVCGAKGKILFESMSELYNEDMLSMIRIPCLADIPPYVSIYDAARERLNDMEFLNASFVSMNQLSVTELVRLHFTLKQMIQQTCKPIECAILALVSFRISCGIVPYLYVKIQNYQSNRTHYRHTQELKQFILQSCVVGNVCTGKLVLATLLYLNRGYSQVVAVVQKVLKQLKPYTLYNGSKTKTLPDIHQYMHQICVKGLTMKQKLTRGIVAFPFMCCRDSKFFPQEIEPEITQHSNDRKVSLPPVVYCNILLFLSYRRLGCRNKMIDTLKELYQAVQCDHFVDESEKPLANAVLERCIHICEKRLGV